VVVALFVTGFKGMWGVTMYVKLRITGLPEAPVAEPLVPEPLVDEEPDIEPLEELDEVLLEELLPELLPDELDPPEVLEEPLLFELPEEPDFELLDLDLLLVLLFAVPPPCAPPAPPVVLVPPVPPCPPVVPVPVPPWPDPEVPLVPLRLVPDAPPAAVPPTVPMSASTSHRTTVLLALSSEPFSTTYSVTSPWSTSTSLMSKSGPDSSRFAR